MSNETATPAPRDEREEIPGHFCGGPMSKNPHPQAGVPEHICTIGTVYECIPCLVKSRHDWADRAGKAERERNEMRAELERVKDMTSEWLSVAEHEPPQKVPVNVWCSGSESAGVAWATLAGWFIPEPQAIGYTTITHWRPIPGIDASRDAEGGEV